MRRLHRDGHVPKVRIAVSGPLHRHAFPPSDAHEPLQVPRKAVRAGSPAGVLREGLGAALSAARWHEVALTACVLSTVGEPVRDAGPLGAVVGRLALNLRHRKPAMAITIIFRMLCSVRRVGSGVGEAAKTFE